MATRLDQSEGFVHCERTPSGGLRIDARLTRVGVLTYRMSDGSERREFRPPEEVFDAASMASLRGAAVTVFHPKDENGEDCLVTPENWSALSVGNVGDNIRAEEIYLCGSVLVQESDALTQVESKDLIENSCGYECEEDPTPGEYQGQPYDIIQRKIRYNHVALLPPGTGRAGPNVRLRSDSAQAICPVMRKHRVDGIEYEAGSDSHVAAVDKAVTTLTDRIIAAEKRADSAEKLLADTKKRADSAEAAASNKAIAKAAARRADLLAFARTRTKLGPKYRKDEGEEGAGEPADLMTIIKDVIAELAPDMDLSGVADTDLPGILRGLIHAKGVGTAAPDAGGAETADAEDEEEIDEPTNDGEDEEEEKKAPALDSITSARGRPRRRNDAVERTEEKALADLRQRSLNAWKGKPTQAARR